jgi:hypothetical protein
MVGTGAQLSELAMGFRDRVIGRAAVERPAAFADPNDPLVGNQLVAEKIERLDASVPSEPAPRLCSNGCSAQA